MTLPVPVWIVGALVGGLFGLFQGMWIRQLMMKNAQTTGGAVPALARFIVPMEAAVFGIVGGFVASEWFGGN